MANETQTKRSKLEILRRQLENERSTFLPHWRDLGDFILPRRPRFFLSDANKGDRRNQKIIDATATMASRTLRSGMMSGVTSPARDWKRLTTPDPDLAEFGPVKEWLYTVNQRMSTVFLRSNLYNALPTIYGDLGTFGTSAMLAEEDIDDVLRFIPLPIGSYMLANNHKLKVDVFFREFRMTVRQIVQHFAKRNLKTNKIEWDNFSSHVKDLYETGNYEVWVDVCHAIIPNDEYKEGSALSKYKKYLSIYYEKGSGSNSSGYLDKTSDVFLRQAGYDLFPVLCPRWEVTGEDVYGTDCPGMTVLGDVKALQLLQKRKAQAIEKKINPPMVGDPSLRQQKTSLIPGDVTWAEETTGLKFRPAHETNISIVEMINDIQEHQFRVRKGYFEDLFLMLANINRSNITAREIDERHEEKLLALGPVLEQLNQDLLDPLIDLTFSIMLKQGLIPEPPEELQGQDLKVEYISIMAQAQKLVSLAGIERFTGYIGQLAQIDPSVVRKVDLEQMIDVYGDITSVAPSIIRPDEVVQEMKMREQQAQAMQAQAQVMQQQAQAAKNLAQANLDGDNALSRLVDQAEAGDLTQ